MSNARAPSIPRLSLEPIGFARTTLALGPAPHPYRRIEPDGDGFVLAVKEWRVRFRVADRHVHVTDRSSGCRRSQLEDAAAGEDPLPPRHRAFLATFGG